MIGTMTTVGYGDYTPNDPIGRVVSSFACVCGIVLLALTSMVVTDSLSLSNFETTLLRRVLDNELEKVEMEAAALLVQQVWRVRGALTRRALSVERVPPLVGDLCLTSGDAPTTAPATAPATAPGAAAEEDGAAAAARQQQLRVVRGILQHLRVQTPDPPPEGGARGRARRSARNGARGLAMSSSLRTNLPRDDDDYSLPPPDEGYPLPNAPTSTTSISGKQGSSVAITSISGSRGSRSLSNVLADLRSDEWQPLRTSSRWRNPCFISSFLTVSSVASACHHGALHFGVGPLLVLLSSILYWQDPVREIALTLMAS